MRRRNSTMICREAIWYLFLLGFVVAGALVRDINLLMVIAGMMVGPLLYSWRSIVVSLRNIGLERELPASICAGDLLVARIRLTNKHARRTLWAIAVEDSIRCEVGPNRGERTRAGVFFEHMPARTTRELTYSGRLQQRGRYRFRQLAASTRFPLGLLRRTTRFDIQHELVVYPRPGRLWGRWMQLHDRQLVGSRHARRQQGASEGDFFGLRDWRPGDSRRWIHWKTSARRGSLVVRQFEQQRNEDLLLLVDLWQPRSPSEAQVQNVELAVSFAATAVADICRRGNCQLFLGLGGKEPRSLGGVASMGLREELMTELAVCEADPRDCLPQLLSEGLPQIHPSATAVIVGTRPVDLADGERFADLPDEVAGHLATRRIICIDAGSPQLADYFEWESNEVAEPVHVQTSEAGSPSG